MRNATHLNGNRVNMSESPFIQPEKTVQTDLSLTHCVHNLMYPMRKHSGSTKFLHIKARREASNRQGFFLPPTIRHLICSHVLQNSCECSNTEVYSTKLILFAYSGQDIPVKPQVSILPYSSLPMIIRIRVLECPKPTCSFTTTHVLDLCKHMVVFQ